MFEQFSKAVHAQFNAISKGELFVVDIDGDALYAAYLAAFPEGTNPIFRVNTEHDCSCCKNFIRNLGNVVSIQNGRLVTVWDGLDDLPRPYSKVASDLGNIIRTSNIKHVFRSEMPAEGD